jgi:large subunit ribosomal protein L31
MPVVYIAIRNTTRDVIVSRVRSAGFKSLGARILRTLLYWIVVVILKEPAVRAGIHPKYHEVEVRCACGNTFKTRSTKPDLHLEICNQCHPFFTGRQKLIDTEGRVERFTKRFGAQTAEARKAATQATRAAKKTKSKKTTAATT